MDREPEPPPPTDAAILADRGKLYGDAGILYGFVDQVGSAIDIVGGAHGFWQDGKHSDLQQGAHRALLRMAALKLLRIAAAPGHADSYADARNYITLAQQQVTNTNNKEAL